jgi:hypothetical protein
VYAVHRQQASAVRIEREGHDGRGERRLARVAGVPYLLPGWLDRTLPKVSLESVEDPELEEEPVPVG